MLSIRPALLFVPVLLKALGVNNVIVLNGEVNGKFAHNPEPLPENLLQLSSEVVKQRADLGIAVDPGCGPPLFCK